MKTITCPTCQGKGYILFKLEHAPDGSGLRLFCSACLSMGFLIVPSPKKKRK